MLVIIKITTFYNRELHHKVIYDYNKIHKTHYENFNFVILISDLIVFFFLKKENNNKNTLRKKM